MSVWVFIEEWGPDFRSLQHMYKKQEAKPKLDVVAHTYRPQIRKKLYFWAA